jgi:alkylation response protein AidB-like acyl-CoA dehydrogenase
MHARTAGLHNVCLAALADAGDADPHQLEVLAAATKAHAADAALRVCEDAIQLQGGMGFTTENELNLYYKRALALRGWYGDETELALRVGTALLEPLP